MYQDRAKVFIRTFGWPMVTVRGMILKFLKRIIDLELRELKFSSAEMHHYNLLILGGLIVVHGRAMEKIV